MASSKENKAVVLVCMDGSEYGDNALDWYLQTLHNSSDTVILCNCVEVHAMPALPLEGTTAVDLLNETLEYQRRAAKQYLEKLSEKMKAEKLHGKVEQCYGQARTELLRVAKKEGATLIVVGTRGLGMVRRSLLGSVSDHIVHHAHVPVVVCKHEKDKQ